MKTLLHLIYKTLFKFNCWTHLMCISCFLVHPHVKMRFECECENSALSPFFTVRLKHEQKAQHIFEREGTWPSQTFLFTAWCVPYLSGRAAAVARFGSRLWHLERCWSLQAAATAVGGDTTSASGETALLWSWLLLLPEGLQQRWLSSLSDLHRCGEKEGSRTKQLVTSQCGLQRAGGKMRKRKTRVGDGQTLMKYSC